MESKFLWLTAIIVVALVAGSFIGYNGQDRDQFERAWKKEFLKHAKPGEYDYHDLSVYIDEEMIKQGYVIFNGNYYKNGVKVEFKELPRP